MAGPVPRNHPGWVGGSVAGIRGRRRDGRRLDLPAATPHAAACFPDHSLPIRCPRIRIKTWTVLTGDAMHGCPAARRPRGHTAARSLSRAPGSVPAGRDSGARWRGHVRVSLLAQVAPVRPKGRRPYGWMQRTPHLHRFTTVFSFLEPPARPAGRAKVTAAGRPPQPAGT
jgi:hypothetical protein